MVLIIVTAVTQNIELLNHVTQCATLPAHNRDVTQPNGDACVTNPAIIKCDKQLSRYVVYEI